MEGLTLEELRNTLTDQFSTYILNPQLYLRQVVFRPVRVFVGGEVKLPGYYTLSGVTSLSNRYGWQEMQQPPFQSSIDISPTDININWMDMTQPAGEQLPGISSPSLVTQTRAPPEPYFRPCSMLFVEPKVSLLTLT